MITFHLCVHMRFHASVVLFLYIPNTAVDELSPSMAVSLAIDARIPIFFKDP